MVTNVTALTDLSEFEIDVLMLSGANFAHGFEIKVTKADLKKDLKKTHIANIDTIIRGKRGFEKYFKKLKYFSYVVPKELEESASLSIPSFCGLYVCTMNKYGGISISEIRKPKKLFEYKWSDDERYKLARLGALRIFSCKMRELRDIHRNNNTSNGL